MVSRIQDDYYRLISYYSIRTLKMFLVECTKPKEIAIDTIYLEMINATDDE